MWEPEVPSDQRHRFSGWCWDSVLTLGWNRARYACWPPSFELEKSWQVPCAIDWAHKKWFPAIQDLSSQCLHNNHVLRLSNQEGRSRLASFILSWETHRLEEEISGRCAGVFLDHSIVRIVTRLEESQKMTCHRNILIESRCSSHPPLNKKSQSYNPFKLCFKTFVQ